MSRAQTFQLFRSCSSSFSSRHLAPSSFNAAGRRLAGARFYSAQTAKEETGKKGDVEEDVERAEESEKDEVTVTPEHELVKKLKKKEEEVQDLMVSVARSFTSIPPFNDAHHV